MDPTHEAATPGLGSGPTGARTAHRDMIRCLWEHLVDPLHQMESQRVPCRVERGPWFTGFVQALGNLPEHYQLCSVLAFGGECRKLWGRHCKACGSLRCKTHGRVLARLDLRVVL